MSTDTVDESKYLAPEPTPEKKYSTETDPLFQEISDEKKAKIDSAVEKKIKSLTLDENVDKDSFTIPGQNYALISIVSPETTQKTKDFSAIKIKGVFDKIDDAREHADKLQKLDPTFDIYVVEMYSWLLVPPDPELIEQVHVDTKLNEIIAGHRESQLKSKMYFEERKRELLDSVNIDDDDVKELENKEPFEEVSASEVLDELNNQTDVKPVDTNEKKTWADQVD
tara:strand:+ start:244 stop:918 length:675 start_codon:yes stop_codon:yes gene_type:complete